MDDKIECRPDRIKLLILLVPGAGIEPARPFGQGILSSTQYCPLMFTEQ